MRKKLLGKVAVARLDVGRSGLSRTIELLFRNPYAPDLVGEFPQLALTSRTGLD
jgi:hypothetical protein